MNIDFKKILVLAPHIDDEVACAGVVYRFVEERKDVVVAVFSFAEKSMPNGFDKDVGHYEFEKSISLLGIDPFSSVYRYNYEVRCFPEYRQQILENLVSLQKDVDPDLVLLPTHFDIHQDHQTICREGVRAFSKTGASILGYEWPHNTMGFKHTTYIHIEDRHLRRKFDCMHCYKSQQHRSYISTDYIKSIATIYGVQAGVKYAEAFETIKLRI